MNADGPSLDQAALEELEQSLLAIESDEGRQVAQQLMLEWMQFGEAPSAATLNKPRTPFPEFIRNAWHVVEPDKPYKHNWHIDHCCQLLEATLRGEVRNLVVNIPPGTMKSLLFCVFFPAWVWTFKPAHRFLFFSHDQRLSTRDSLKCRRLIESDWYQNNWGDVFQLVGDQNEKTRFENNRTGYRAARSVGGGTGEKADTIVVDDPIDQRKTHQETQREMVKDWWTKTIPLRLSDVSTGVKIIVMQRLHEEDLSGHVLSKEFGYVHYRIPMRFELENKCTTPLEGVVDPRTAEGELLWPELFPDAELKPIEKELGSYGVAGQMQQRPSPAGGGLFRRKWFKIVDVIPRKAGKRVRFWDMAGTDGIENPNAAWTVGVRLSEHDDVIYVEHVRRGQWSAKEVDDNLESTAKTDGVKVRQREEQEGGSAGKAVIASHATLLKGFDYKGLPSTGDKVTRARPFASYAEAGNVCVLNAEWTEEYLDELESFPNGKFKDQVDATSGGFNEIMHGDWAGMGGVF
jgi:predicted phage terminase large subunit-like protein